MFRICRIYACVSLWPKISVLFKFYAKGLRIMRSRILRVRRKILWIQFLVEHVVGNVVNCVIPYFNGV